MHITRVLSCAPIFLPCVVEKYVLHAYMTTYVIHRWPEHHRVLGWALAGAYSTSLRIVSYLQTWLVMADLISLL